MQPRFVQVPSEQNDVLILWTKKTVFRERRSGRGGSQEIDGWNEEKLHHSRTTSESCPPNGRFGEDLRPLVRTLASRCACRGGAQLGVRPTSGVPYARQGEICCTFFGPPPPPHDMAVSQVGSRSGWRSRPSIRRPFWFCRVVNCTRPFSAVSRSGVSPL